MKKHSKKKNVGLMYEFLIRHITTAVINNDNLTAEKTLNILKRHFKPGSQLYREWRLFNAVIKIRNLDELSATTVIRETRSAAEKISIKDLESEKRTLTRVINRDLGQKLFEHVIPTYRMHATVQTLFNDWRADAPNVIRIVDYERKLIEHLTTKTQNADVHDVNNNPLVVKLMTDKFNSKYNEHLLPRQRLILSEYTVNGHSDKLHALLSEVKNDALSAIKNYNSNCNDKFVSKKIESVEQQINEIAINKNDEANLSVSQCMKLCELINELTVK